METLRKLLTDQIKISERINLVQTQKFREGLKKAMLGDTNKQINIKVSGTDSVDFLRDGFRHLLSS
ncbi:hypothetical protein LBMAG52_36020 [Planctomycetia bacterium]|nr:hypothetical protein LBMAG52_36020 [Planctomycetia bacterium]